MRRRGAVRKKHNKGAQSTTATQLESGSQNPSTSDAEAPERKKGHFDTELSPLELEKNVVSHATVLAEALSLQQDSGLSAAELQSDSQNIILIRAQTIKLITTMILTSQSNLRKSLSQITEVLKGLNDILPKHVHINAHPYNDLFETLNAQLARCNASSRESDAEFYINMSMAIELLIRIRPFLPDMDADLNSITSQIGRLQDLESTNMLTLLNMVSSVIPPTNPLAHNTLELNRLKESERSLENCLKTWHLLRDTQQLINKLEGPLQTPSLPLDDAFIFSGVQASSSSSSSTQTLLIPDNIGLSSYLPPFENPLLIPVANPESRRLGVSQNPWDGLAPTAAGASTSESRGVKQPSKTGYNPRFLSSQNPSGSVDEPDLRRKNTFV